MAPTRPGWSAPACDRSPRAAGGFPVPLQTYTKSASLWWGPQICIQQLPSDSFFTLLLRTSGLERGQRLGSEEGCCAVLQPGPLFEPLPGEAGAFPLGR